MDPNDEWAIFTALKRWRDDKKINRFTEWAALGGIKVLQNNPLFSNVRMHSGYHYTFSVEGEQQRVSYYPTSGRWVLAGKKYEGGLESMFGFFRNRQPQPQSTQPTE